MPLVDPNIRQFAATAPSMAVVASDDFARIVPDATGQKTSVVVSRRLGIEFVNAIGQEGGELLALGLIADWNDFSLHDA